MGPGSEQKDIGAIHSEIRERFPLLDRDLFGNERAYLNCGAGTLTVDFCIQAMADAVRTAHPMPGDVYPAETATRDFHSRVRQMTADFINAFDLNEISFHNSTTQALFNLAYALQPMIQPQENVVVTDLDHMANVSPWERVQGELMGCQIRRSGIDDKGRLDIEHLMSLVDKKTRILALTMASNAFGSIVPLASIIASVKKISPRCLVCVDAVHHSVHGPIDVQSIGCDFLAFSGYKIFGPMLGILWGRREWLNDAYPYRVETSKNVPPYSFEQGMLNNPVLAGFAGALEYFLWLGEQLFPEELRRTWSRRQMFLEVMKAVEKYDQNLGRMVLEGFEPFDPEVFSCYGLDHPGDFTQRDPTFAFDIKGLSADTIKDRLWESRRIQIGSGNHYSAAVYRVFKRPSLARASFCHYDTPETVRSFLQAVEDLIEIR